MSETRSEIEAVYVVKTRDVDFLGVLVACGSRFKANGRMLFEDGSRWFLDSPPGEREAVRSQLEELSEDLAGCYGTTVVRLEFDGPMPEAEFVRRLREANAEVVMH